MDCGFSGGLSSIEVSMSMISQHDPRGGLLSTWRYRTTDGLASFPDVAGTVRPALRRFVPTRRIRLCPCTGSKGAPMFSISAGGAAETHGTAFGRAATVDSG